MNSIKTKKILIDGFNLIYRFPDLEEKMMRNDLGGAMSGLTALVAAYAKKMKKNCIIIYDGKKKEGLDIDTETVSGVRIIYSLNYSADYLIMQSIKHDLQPKMTTVITSDNAIIGYLKKFGTPVIRSEDFAPLMEKSLEEEIKEEDEKSADVQMSSEELKFWEDMFARRKTDKKRR